jgi:HTH-type transcriptional regulator, glycine betaine synthesis regulator
MIENRGSKTTLRRSFLMPGKNGTPAVQRPTRSRASARPSLVAVQDRFIASWGQMGSTWGVSRTMAEVHALLYITGEPLCTDDVMERLEISRGNASMSLRALLDWGIITRVHKRGDRKEYFSAEQDPWLIVQSVVRERLKRELHPVLAALAELRDATGRGGIAADAHARRLDEMIHLLQVFGQLGERFVGAPSNDLRAMAEALSEGANK